MSAGLGKMRGEAMSAAAKDDLDMIPLATGLLTIEVAFLVVFIFGGPPKESGDISGGFTVFKGWPYFTTLGVLCALVGALLCAAATLVAAAAGSARADRLIRMSAALLGLAGITFGLHVVLVNIVFPEGREHIVVGFVILAVASGLLLLGAWRFTRPNAKNVDVSVSEGRAESPIDRDLPASGA